MYPAREKRGPSQGLEWLLRAARRAGRNHPGSKWAPVTKGGLPEVWDGEKKSRLSPGKTLKYI